VTVGGGSFDGLVAVWCALWLVVGAWTGYEVWQLSDLAETVEVTGRSLDEAGIALESLAEVPVVGGGTAELGSRVRADAREIVVSADQATGSIRRLSVLLGLVIALVPSVPVVVARHTALHAAARATPGA
jgi:hypothetical protein